MKTYFGKLKPLDDCLYNNRYNMVVHENTKNYWKIHDPNTDTSIGFKTFYKKYFGSDEIFKIEEHKKNPNLVYVNIGKNVKRPVFKHWVEQVSEEPKQVPVMLNGLLDKWEELFNYDE